MRAHWTTPLLAAAMFAGAACSSDGGSGPSSSEITGTWQLTKVLFVSQANPQLSVDLIAQGGTATLTIDANHTFAYILTMPATAPDSTTGTWALSGDVVTMIRDGMSGDMQFQVTVSSSAIKLAGASVDFDVNDDGTDEPARMTIEGTR